MKERRVPMTVTLLSRHLVSTTKVAIIDREKNKVIWEGVAGEAKFADRVVEWDFSHELMDAHIIYI